MFNAKDKRFKLMKRNKIHNNCQRENIGKRIFRKSLGIIYFPLFFFVQKKITYRKSSPEKEHQGPDPYSGFVVFRNGIIQGINSCDDQ